LKVVLGYSVKNYIELPLESNPVLSPFDYEYIVLTDHVLQPEITPSGIHGDPVFVKTPGCKRGLYINKDRLQCSVEAGFSHPAHGVAVVKGGKGPRVIIGGDAIDCDKAVYNSRPWVFIVTCFDGSYSYLIFTTEKSILYTGDFRFDLIPSERLIEEILKHTENVDAMITEFTGVHRRNPFILDVLFS